jgi:hypothetical protein
MNVKHEAKVSKKHLDSIVQYHKECGWDVLASVKPEDSRNENVTYYSTAPGYGTLTPLAVSMKIDGRWTHYTYIRLPKPEPDPVDLTNFFEALSS